MEEKKILSGNNLNRVHGGDGTTSENTNGIHNTFVVNRDQCVSCGECAAICPACAANLDSDGTYCIDPNHCIECGCCVNVCPAHAISHAD